MTNKIARTSFTLAAALLLVTGHAAFAQPISSVPGIGIAPTPNPAAGAMELKAAISPAEVFPNSGGTVFALVAVADSTGAPVENLADRHFEIITYWVPT